MIGKSFDMSALLPPALAKVQKCTNVQGVVVQMQKFTSVQVYNVGGVGGVDQQDAPPFPLRGGAYDHRGLRTSSSPHSSSSS